MMDVVDYICKDRPCPDCPLFIPKAACFGVKYKDGYNTYDGKDVKEYVVSCFAELFPELVDQLDDDLKQYIYPDISMTEEDLMEMLE